MRVQTDTYNVYKFEELSEDVQEKVLDKFRESEDFPFLSDDLNTELEELLKENKITYDDMPKLFYSLNYCQGDGAMFEGVVYWKSYTAVIRQSGHYYHYNSKSISLYSTKTDKEASEKVEEEFNSLYVDICKELEKYGYEQIDYMLSEKAIRETIDANEYEFTENGVLV